MPERRPERASAKTNNTIFRFLTQRDSRRVRGWLKSCFMGVFIARKDA
jgi:hypothetical protein